MDITAFHTRKRANEGIKVPLRLPDGTPTDHWLQIRSIWSDAYSEARAEFLRQAIEDGRKVAEAQEKGEALELVRKEREAWRNARLLASLVVAWSFPQECTLDAVTAFLIEAPQIAKAISDIAEDDRRFFGKGSANSSNGADPK